MTATIQVRRGTAAQWTSANTVLAAGEIGFETDTNKHKIGDGTSTWSQLVYFLSETQLGVNPAGSQATVKARLEYGERFGLPAGVYWPSGGYISPHISTGSNTTINLIDDKIYVCPWVLPASATVDRIAVSVSTSQTSAVGRLGLYSAGSVGYPDSLIADFGEVAFSSTGTKELTISQSVTSGTLYWFAVLNSTASVALSATANGGRAIYNLNSSTFLPSPAFRANATYGSGLPSTFPGTIDSPMTTAPIFLLRRS